MTGLATIAIRNGRSLSSTPRSLLKTTPLIHRLGTQVRHWGGGRGATGQDAALRRREKEYKQHFQESVPVKPIETENGEIIYPAAPAPRYSTTTLRKRVGRKQELRGIDVETSIPTSLLDQIEQVATKRGKERITKRQSMENLINMTKNERAMRQMLVRYAKANPLKDGTYPKPYIVGGWVRDKILGAEDDIHRQINVVVEGMEGMAFGASMTEYIRNYGNSLGKANMGVEMTGFTGVRIRKVNPVSGIPLRKQKADHKKASYLHSAEAILYSNHVEIRSLRTRKKEYVEATIEDDAEYRDATVNCLYYSLNWKVVEDPTGMGLKDLYDKVLRPPIAAARCFENDRVRTLRYVRLAAKYGFTIVPEALDVMKAEWNRKGLRDAPREYVNLEIEKMAKSGCLPKALDLIRDLELYNSIFDLELTEKEAAGVWDYPKEEAQTHQISPPRYGTHETAVKVLAELLNPYNEMLSHELQCLLMMHTPILWKLALCHPYSKCGIYARKTEDLKKRTDMPFYNHTLVRAYRIGLRPGYFEEELVRCAMRDCQEIQETATKLHADPDCISTHDLHLLATKWFTTTGTARRSLAISLSVSYALLTALTEATLSAATTPDLYSPEKKQILTSFTTLAARLYTLDIDLPQTTTPLYQILLTKNIASSNTTTRVPTQFTPKPALHTLESYKHAPYKTPTPASHSTPEFADYRLRRVSQGINQQMKHFGPQENIMSVTAISDDGKRERYRVSGEELAMRMREREEKARLRETGESIEGDGGVREPCGVRIIRFAREGGATVEVVREEEPRYAKEGGVSVRVVKVGERNKMLREGEDETSGEVSVVHREGGLPVVHREGAELKEVQVEEREWIGERDGTKSFDWGMLEDVKKEDEARG